MNSTLRQKGLSVNLQRRFWTKTLGRSLKRQIGSIYLHFWPNGMLPWNTSTQKLISCSRYHIHEFSLTSESPMKEWYIKLYKMYFMPVAWNYLSCIHYNCTIVQLYNKFISLFCISRVCIWWINAQSTLSPCGEFQIAKLMINCYWRWICQDLKCRKLSTWKKLSCHVKWINVTHVCTN